MLNKYLYEYPESISLVAAVFISILLVFVFLVVPFTDSETSGLLSLRGLLTFSVFSFVLLLILFNIIISNILESFIIPNGKRMIAYANGGYPYSDIMRESIKQTDTPESALSYFNNVLIKQNRSIYEQRIKEAAERVAKKEEIKRNKVIQKFKEENAICISFVFLFSQRVSKPPPKWQWKAKNIVVVVENRKNIVRQRYPLSGSLKINTPISGCLPFF